MLGYGANMLSFFTKITNIILFISTAIIALALYLPSKGVKTANNLEQYALRYIKKNALLEQDEKLVAYYDASFMMNSKDALILTDKRISHHYNHNTVSINLEDISEMYYLSKNNARQKTIIVRDKNDNVLSLALYHDQDLFVEFLNNSLKNKFNL